MQREQCYICLPCNESCSTYPSAIPSLDIFTNHRHHRLDALVACSKSEAIKNIIFF